MAYHVRKVAGVEGVEQVPGVERVERGERVHVVRGVNESAVVSGFRFRNLKGLATLRAYYVYWGWYVVPWTPCKSGPCSVEHRAMPGSAQS